MMCAHHSSLLTLSRWSSRILEPEGEVVRVQVDSSTWISWGRSPYAFVNSYRRGEGENYIYKRFLSFHAEHKLLLLDIDNQILSFQVARYFDCDIQITDCLSPFVRKSSLFLCFFRASCSLFLGSRVFIGDIDLYGCSLVKFRSRNLGRQLLEARALEIKGLAAF